MVWKIVVVLAVATGLEASRNIQTLPLHQLAANSNLLRSALKEDGAFAVSGLGKVYKTAVTQLAMDTPACFQTEELEIISLDDGSVRRTYATNTDSYPACIDESANEIRVTFDTAFDVVAMALEEEFGKAAFSWREDEDAEPSSLKDFGKKEHIHVYEQIKSTSGKAAASHSLPFHVDNGILLMLTPFPAHPLQIKNLDGDILSASTPKDSVIFVVARGLPDWLLKGTDEESMFHAAPHAVPTLRNLLSRTVFARMLVAPMTAVPANPLAAPEMFEDVFVATEVGDEEGLCPVDTITFRTRRSPCAVGNDHANCWPHTIRT